MFMLDGCSVISHDRPEKDGHRTISCQGGQLLKRLSDCALKAGMHYASSEGGSLGLEFVSVAGCARRLLWVGCAQA